MKKLSLVIGLGFILSLLFFQLRDSSEISINSHDSDSELTNQATLIKEVPLINNNSNSTNPTIEIPLNIDRETVNAEELVKTLPGEIEGLNIVEEDLVKEEYVQLLPGGRALKVVDVSNVSLSDEVLPGFKSMNIPVSEKEFISNKGRYIAVLPGMEPKLVAQELSEDDSSSSISPPL
jgi:hypothetical protein